MKLSKINNKILMEVLDFKNIESFDYTKLSTDHYQFDVNGDTVDVMFDEFDFDVSHFKVVPLLEPFNGRKLINVGYKFNQVETQYKKLDVRSFLPILKTVVEILKEYAQVNKPYLISIFATGRDNFVDTDATKLKIYELLVSKYHPAGYGVSKISLDGDDGILLYDTQKLNLILRRKL